MVKRNNLLLITGAMLIVAALTTGVNYAVKYAKYRGIRNNNPGNIERDATNWLGMSPQQTDVRFITFTKPEYGIRAMARILKNYARLYGITNLDGLIKRWSETDQDPYIANVSREIGIQPTTPINVQQVLPKLIPAMIRQENGVQPYTQSVIDQGIAMEIAS